MDKQHAIELVQALELQLAAATANLAKLRRVINLEPAAPSADSTSLEQLAESRPMPRSSRGGAR